MYVIIDRFEGEYAVCERKDRTMIDIEKKKIPSTAKEGDVLFIQGKKIVIDNQKTLDRKKEIENIVEDLWE